MWFKIHAKQIELKIFAKPNAKRSALLAINEQGLHIAIHAKPHDGAANDELIKFLANLFAVAKSHITLKSGTSSRYKWVSMPLNAKLEQLTEDPENFLSAKK